MSPYFAMTPHLLPQLLTVIGMYYLNCYLRRNCHFREFSGTLFSNM